MKNYKPLRPINLSRHKTSKSSIKIREAYHNVNKLISESPLELWNIINHPNKTKGEFIGVPEFLRLKNIVQKQYPDIYKKHCEAYAKKCKKKQLLKDLSNGDVNSGKSKWKHLG